MTIRNTRMEDMEAVMALFCQARQKMRRSGNFVQWTGEYPSREAVEADIDRESSYVVEDDGVVVATFAFVYGADPTYAYIEGGEWPNDKPYATVHRMASAEGVHGVAHEVFSWACTQIDCVRADTHEANAPMLHILEKEGFKYCGIIYVSDGSPRRAFQKDI